ncbi:MAG TPA: multidrug ABC transporter ATP-binding protein [Methylophilaceae bacterium]|nr:multidrug ABC transporter ATP-binding protein [Methylophilaceae bacterium]
MFKYFEKLLNPFPEDFLVTPPKTLLPFVWLCTKNLRWLILCMALLTAFIGSFEAVLFSYMGSLIDLLNHSNRNDFLNQHLSMLLSAALILILSTFLILFQTLIKHQALAGTFPMRMRWNFHRLLLNQSMNFYHNEFAGRVAAKVMQTALAVRDLWFILADILIYVVIYFLTMILVIGKFNYVLMLPFVGWVMFYILALIYFVPRLSKLSRNQADARSLMTGRITDAYTNISTIKLFSHAGREANFAKVAMKEFLLSVNKQMRLVSWIEIINHLLSMLLVIGTAMAAIWLWSSNEIMVGVIATSTAMALRLNGISHWVMWEMTSLYEQIGILQDGLNTLSMHQEIKDKKNAKDLLIKKASVSFQNIVFNYPAQKKSVITNFSLHIKSGEKVGLVGRSGSGKSTLVNLLLRFYDLKSGVIMIDNQDISGIKQNSLREKIGMVTQDTSLLHRSVKDNIAYGRPKATQNEIIRAAKRAKAHDFIMQLEDNFHRKGYEAHVGERGVKLSGGQRQRISIARVMLKDAPILLLDEATSALDSEIEVVIQQSLYQLMEGKTVIAIAHRLSTIAKMDRLIVIDKGRIIEEGSHAKLIKKNGLYARLWKHQSGGFLGKA